MTSSWIASRRLGAAGEHVADRRRGLGIDVEVVRQVALRVEVDGQHVEADAPEDVGQGPDRRRLAGAALLGEDCDRGAQGRLMLLGLQRRAGRRRRPAPSDRRSAAGSGR